MALSLVALTGFRGDEGSGGGDARIVTVVEAGRLDAPSVIAVRPGSGDQLWITNAGADSVTTVSHAGGRHPKAVTRTDAYAEHFVARPGARPWATPPATS